MVSGISILDFVKGVIAVGDRLKAVSLWSALDKISRDADRMEVGVGGKWLIGMLLKGYLGYFS